VILAAKIIHVAFAAAWFGHKLLIPRDLRQSIHQREDGEAVIARMRRAERFGIVSGFGTVLSGLALIWLTTGFADTPLPIWLGLAAALAMFVVGGAVARPAWRVIRQGLAEDDYPRAASRSRSFVSALHLEGLLWVLALTAMLI
jgi:hypothetical protein